MLVNALTYVATAISYQVRIITYLKFLRVPASLRPRVSPNDKSSPEHDIICNLLYFINKI
ncbi:MAG: hypothetical protein RM338_11485 [Nostoc sp. DedQUE12a]|nr:hypothetical protein [Nostoc sp. DedQUE12a]